MKRKALFFFILTVVICCAFTVIISAEGIKKFETNEFQSGDNITYLEGINEDMYYKQDDRNNSFYELLDPDFTARAVLKNSDGTYTTYPAWYFVYFYHYWNGADCCYLVDRVNAFSDITGETYSLSSIIRFEQPEYKKNHGFALKNGSSSLTMSNAVYVRVASHFTSIGGLFRGMRALTEIEFAPNANITSVGDKTFVDCASLEIIRLPNTATSMGSEVFCYWTTSTAGAALKEIYLGASLSSMGTKNPINTANVPGLKIYVPTTLDGATYTYPTHFPKTSMLIFTGTKEQAEAFNATKVISYEDYLASDCAHEAGTIVYGYSTCDAFYDGEHIEMTIDNNPCVLADCERCIFKNHYVGNEFTHEIKNTISYEDYSKDGYRITYCSNEGCIHKIKEEVEALFNCLGYSASQTPNRYGIVLGFTVNKNAILDFEAVTNKKISYGVFAVSQSKLVNGDILTDNLTFSDGVVNAELPNNPFDVFEIKIVGLTEENKDIKLALGAYVITTDDEKASISLMQSGTPSENRKYTFISYSDLIDTSNN